MCKACEVVRVNGVACHETGCPEAWKDYSRKCLWCGQLFKPEEEHQTCCDASCTAAYYGLPEPETKEIT